MNIDGIKKLLELFYNGESSIEEEQILYSYFSNNEVDTDLAEEKEVFLQLYQDNNIEIPSDLEPRLNNLIDDLSQKENKTRSKSIKHLWMWVASAASCVAILLGTSIYYNKISNISQPNIANGQSREILKDSYTDPNEAQLQAEKALQLVANNLNKGMGQLALVSTNIDKTNEILDKSLNRTNR